jgi:hypothetical protein
MLQTQSTDKAELFQRYQKYATDPWAFLVDCVYTQDQVDRNCPIKKFPGHLLYLKLYVRVWQKCRLVGIPKSRRMYMSWVNIALYLWDTMFHVGKHNAFVSKKEDDADDLIKRAKFIFENIPEDKIPKAFLPKMEYKFCHLVFPELSSKIQGFPQGADQLRAYTFSGILGDEMAFWPEAQKMYATSYPTLEGGGRFTAISSPGPGFFKDLVFDQFDDGNGAVSAAAASPGEKELPRYPMEGVEVWRNPGNKFVIYQLHYSANPEKRESAYRDSIKSAMPYQQYMQEYELVWDSFEGKPVYADFVERDHGTEDDVLPEIGLPLLVGIDFGLTPALVVAQLQGERLVVFCEYTEINMGAKRFLDKVVPQFRLKFPYHNDLRKSVYCFIDPAGFAKAQSDETTCAQEVAKHFSPRGGGITWENRRKSVEDFLIKRDKNGPLFKIVKKSCPVLLRGFNGGYRYPDKAFDKSNSEIRPLKDQHSHPHDALQMITSALKGLSKRTSTDIPTPGYSFGGRR